MSNRYGNTNLECNPKEAAVDPVAVVDPAGAVDPAVDADPPLSENDQNG